MRSVRGAVSSSCVRQVIEKAIPPGLPGGRGLSERWESKLVMRRTWSVVGDFVGLIVLALVVPIAILLLGLPVIGVVRLVMAALAAGVGRSA